ncbi:helix-turn-helix domain-containing protein [Bradyrhizobium sp. Ai1a-2]|uniref:helix-turn-helix transcriptional regulator n=1 Tax=Bradyrhizobium sp. Ai1a-2 TaxID=196490 RepID=UPI0004285B20|nr:helix-turn-helix domain-containing protein [Bradyrhizobium sp. Ai1a-2]
MSRLDTKQAAEYVGCAKSTLDIMRVRGGGPRYIKIGRKVLYNSTDLDKWLEQHTFTSTSAERAARGSARG